MMPLVTVYQYNMSLLGILKAGLDGEKILNSLAEFVSIPENKMKFYMITILLFMAFTLLMSIILLVLEKKKQVSIIGMVSAAVNLLVGMLLFRGLLALNSEIKGVLGRFHMVRIHYLAPILFIMIYITIVVLCVILWRQKDEQAMPRKEKANNELDYLKKISILEEARKGEEVIAPEQPIQNKAEKTPNKKDVREEMKMDNENTVFVNFEKQSNKEGELNALFLELGKAYYETAFDNSLPELQPLVDKITAITRQNLSALLLPAGDVKQVCITCQASLSEHEKFCSKCGTAVNRAKVDAKICNQCGKQVETKAQFCTECGNHLMESK